MYDFISRCAAGSTVTILFATCIAIVGCDVSDNEIRHTQDDEMQVLKDALEKESEWVKVHAAEALLNYGFHDLVLKTFLPEDSNAEPPYRIGVWRVLAQANPNNRSFAEEYRNRIINAFMDVNGPDREHAAESLGKLGYRSSSIEWLRAAKEEKGTLQACVLWVLANTRKPEQEKAWLDLLASDNPVVRGNVVAHGLRCRENISDEARKALEEAYAKEPLRSSSRVYILSALAVHSTTGRQQDLSKELKDYALNGKDNEKKEAFEAYRIIGNKNDVPFLKQRLSEENNVDIRVYCANALLTLGGKNVPCR